MMAKWQQFVKCFHFVAYDMGNIGKFLKWLLIGSPNSIPFSEIGKFFKRGASELGSQLESYVNSQTGAHLTGAQEEANAFTASEAEKSRLWSEHMRATNFQAQVADMQQAGLNPALMYANGGTSTTPSGASATSVAPSGPATLSDLMQMIMLKRNMAKIQAETENIQSQTEVNEVTKGKIQAETTKLGVDTDLVQLQKEWYPKLSEAQIAKIDAEINKLTAEIPYLNSLTSQADANVGLINAQRLLTNKNLDWVDRINTASVNKMLEETSKITLEKWMIDFRQQYMYEYGTDVPSSGWATLGSFILNNGVAKPFSGFFELFKAALKDVFKVELNNKTENNVVSYPERPPLTVQESYK